MNILLGVTGSVAATLTPTLIKELSKLGNIKIVATKKAEYFFSLDDIKTYTDEDEWHWEQKGDDILHIELRKWADIFIIAPLSANTLAKLSLGLCDNLLTSVFRAWNHALPVFIAPAMNTYMWNNYPTQHQINILQKNLHNLHIIPPVEKTLACGDTGVGAMAKIEDIINQINLILQWYFPIVGCPGVPINNHPGAFGVTRKHDIHTGVDLYVNEIKDKRIKAVESGVIIKKGHFTGPQLNQSWWNNTDYIMIEGASGVINYGELKLWGNSSIYHCVEKGDVIGIIDPVLPEGKERPDIIGHSRYMLHLELYKRGTTDFVEWKHNEPQPENLLNPTSLLLNAKNSPELTL